MKIIAIQVFFEHGVAERTGTTGNQSIDIFQATFLLL